METSGDEHESARRLIVAAILGPAFRRATFGGAARGGPTQWIRVAIRPVQLHGRRELQFSYFDPKKDITRNFPPSEAEVHLEEVLDMSFAGIHVSTLEEEIDVRNTKKGKIIVGRKARQQGTDTSEASPFGEEHNRIKDLPLPEGRADQLLETMGILTADGRIRPTMRPKYTQINEFLKHLIHVLDAVGLGVLGRDVEILDCGCGSSYLTLAVHHYLNDILAIPARITGVDVNDEVIRKSTARAEKLSMSGLAFECGRIRSVSTKPDIVLALHACDTATDDAIAQAIASEAKLFLGVPCCHQNLNKSIRAEGEANILRPLLRHGILRQRTADLATDAFRALALRIMGYRADVVEFVGTEHTARNLMIRAVRGGPIGESADIREYLEMRRFWNATPYIERVLGAVFQRFLALH